jgi:uncharacterized membrane protein
MNATALDHPRTRSTFRAIKTLVLCYLGLSVLTLLAVILLRNHPSIVTPPVWVRSSIVVLTAVLMTSFAFRTARGNRRSFLRLRIATGVMLIALAVIIAVPGDFPVWLKVEQGACGLLVLGIVILANNSHTRSLFAR